MADISPEDSLIVYPCAFPIKVMGLNAPGFEAAMVQLVQQFDTSFDASQVELRPSKGQKYLGLTLTITATSRAQLDAIYQALSGHPMVKLAL
jgi:uncharacterized protein